MRKVLQMRIAFRKLTPTPHKDNENLAERVTNVFITITGVAPVLFVTPRGSRDFNPRQSRKGFGRFVEKLGSSMHLFQILFYKCYSIQRSRSGSSRWFLRNQMKNDKMQNTEQTCTK